MKLRNRLFLSSSTLLLVMGGLFAVAHVKFDYDVVPGMLQHVRESATAARTALGANLEVPLGAADPKMIEEAVADLTRDPDLAYIAVRDARGAQVYHHGVVPPPDPTLAADTTRIIGDTARSWTTISVEGALLGRVEVGYSTARIAQMAAWFRWFALTVAVVWLAALAYTWRFARAFVAPIRSMMELAGAVASGRFGEQLARQAEGELGELEAYLNTMARELDARETERQRATARVEAIQRELVEVSRMAGMAEVASGVLHNVGNVLNSLNTSVSVVADQLRASKTAGLVKTVDLYRDHPGGLAGLLATDKGKLVPEYLAKVASHLASENLTAIHELESIRKHVAHIASIVATQQSYTQVAALREPVVLTSLIDDALGMVEGSFARHGVELIKDYQPVPELVTDRHKVLQIVVNLVANARYALKSSPRVDKKLWVRLRASADRAVIQIEDNGVGIPAENLARIFQHGFTTKKNGHGFGLHSSANSAKELDGTLRAVSAGRALGACFTLELPLSSSCRSLHALAS